MHLTLDEIRPIYEHNETCQRCVSKAIIAFLEGIDLEDTIRLTISIGGDSDTLVDMSGAIADVFYKGIPKDISKECYNKLTPDLEDILNRFEKIICK